MIKLKYIMLILCVSISPVLGMQPKKEVKEVKKSWVQRHPILTVVGAAFIGLNLLTQEKCACHPGAIMIGSRQPAQECVKDGDYCYWQPMPQSIRFNNNNDLVPKDLRGKFNNLGEYELDGYERYDSNKPAFGLHSDPMSIYEIQ